MLRFFGSAERGSVARHSGAVRVRRRRRLFGAHRAGRGFGGTGAAQSAAGSTVLQGLVGSELLRRGGFLTGFGFIVQRGTIGFSHRKTPSPLPTRLRPGGSATAPNAGIRRP